MPAEDQLTDEEKEALQGELRNATLSDDELRALAGGATADGEAVTPVDDADDMVTSAASALEFVDSLEAEERISDQIKTEDAVEGYDALLTKLENLRADISSLQRGVVSVFAAQLLTFRGKVVELKSRISEEMVDRLKMKFFKSFIETTFVDIVDDEFSTLEKNLVDKIVEQTQRRFKEFAARVRESEIDLRTTIVEQQEVVRSFMQTLEEEAAAQREKLREKEEEVAELEKEIRSLRQQVGEGKTVDALKEEYERKINSLDEEITSLKREVLQKDDQLKERTEELREANEKIEELRAELGETRSQLEVYKTELEQVETGPQISADKANEYESQIQMLEEKLQEKRQDNEEHLARITRLEEQLNDEVQEREAAEEMAKKRLQELQSVQDRIDEVTQLEEEIYNLKQELDNAQEEISVLKEQKQGFKKASKLMEKERDLALEQRDIAYERMKRYIDVIKSEARTKALLLVDEVGSITFKELAKSLGKPVGLVTKYVRELEKLGVLEIEGEKAVSTLEQPEEFEGEIVIDDEEDEEES
ncbi:MAG: winged helix-turn-helix transcriptional regulator [Candidatus Lokiarchaeota archaeon]|nr:winged helix-turn-helix transcriptional regulator [Candidatus Lokiarchaeota archaeon]